MDQVLACLGGAAFLVMPLLGGWLLVDGFRKGGMLAKGHRYYRSTNPVWFWILTGAYGSLVIGFLGLAGYVLVDYLRS